MENFEEAIAQQDLALFEQIPSQSTDDDKVSLLACQLATRELRPNYNYLEIGSHIGGSIQPHLLDDRCARIFSIDKRPLRQPDERGVDYFYPDNSTARMLENLSKLGPTDKIVTIDRGTDEIDPSEVDLPIDLCFIDGEHTDNAVLRDFKFCVKVLAESGAILFHDASITYNGIDWCLKYLDEQGIAYRAFSLPSIVFVVEVGDFPLHRNARILDMLTNNYKSYIFSLQFNDSYRRFANKAPFRFYRNVITKLRGIRGE
jgi:hypothetical protein